MAELCSSPKSAPVSARRFSSGRVSPAVHQRDGRISGGAIAGSVAAGLEDEWSDIDLAFGVAEKDEVAAVLGDFTAWMYQRHGALHHLDVRAGDWIYRVFLLPGTLQVDLAFVPGAEFRALAPTFRLVFGDAQEGRRAPPPSPESLIGYAWLYAIHARTSIARGKWWQAEHMIGCMRDHALSLACVRRGLPSAHGRGFDRLQPQRGRTVTRAPRCGCRAGCGD
jgi:hypothetical protein